MLKTLGYLFLISLLFGCGSDDTPVLPNSNTPNIDGLATGLTIDDQEVLYISTVKGPVYQLKDNKTSIFINQGQGGLEYGRSIHYSNNFFFVENVLNVGTTLDQIIDEVLLFDNTGEYVNTVVNGSDVSSVFIEAVAVNRAKQVYVATLANNTNVATYRIEQDGSGITGVIIIGDGGVYVAVTLAVDSKDNLYVGTPSVVSKFDADGKFIAKIATKGVDGFEFAKLLAIDKNDNLYVGNTTPTQFNVLKFDSNGAFQSEIISTGAGGLSQFPDDMIVDSKGRIIIADSLSDISGILAFNSDGQFETVLVVNRFPDPAVIGISIELKASKRLEKQTHYQELEAKDRALSNAFYNTTTM